MLIKGIDLNQEYNLEIKSLKNELAELEIRKFKIIKRIEVLEIEIDKLKPKKELKKVK